MTDIIISTERLVLRHWRDADRQPYAAMAADPEVMRYFANSLSHEDAVQKTLGFQACIDKDGFGFWAAAEKSSGVFLGVIGLSRLSDETRNAIPTNPELEIGWSLARSAWGKGLATEGARACLDYAWTVLDAPEIVAFTTPANLPSRRVMEKLGMQHNPAGDFDHPSAPEGSPHRRHVLYRIENPARS